MPVFESTSPTPSEPEADTKFENDLVDQFLDVFVNEPNTEKITPRIKQCFNEMKMATEKAYAEALVEATRVERVRTIERFVERSALNFVSLKEELVKTLELLPELEINKKKTILQELEKTAVLSEGRTLLAFYANRQSATSTKNTENAALQQSLAKFYLRYFDNIESIEPNLDTYGKKSFESSEDYVAMKRGVISLAEAYLHLESSGHTVFFPPPKMDAEQAIDLFYIEETAPEEYKEQFNFLLRDNFSLKKLLGLDPNIASHVYEVQVKTRHNLKKTYEDIYERRLSNLESLTEVLRGLSLNETSFDGLDANITKATTFYTHTIGGIANHTSQAVVLSCTPNIKQRSYSFDGDRPENRENGRKRIVNDFQEACTFLGQHFSIGSAYMFVDHEETPET